MKRRIKQILVVILALCTFLCVPSTVYAKTLTITKVSFGATATDSITHTKIDSVDIDDTTMPRWLFSNTLQSKFNSYHFGFNIGKDVLKDGDTVTCKICISTDSKPGRYQNWHTLSGSITTWNGGDDKYYSCSENENIYYDSQTSTFVFTATVNNVREYTDFGIVCTYPTIASAQVNSTFALGVTSAEISIESESSVFYNKVSDFFSGLFDKLTNWFNQLFQWLKDIRDGNISFADSVGSWFTNLGNNIKTWFNNLSDNISGFFTELKNNLTEWFKNVGNWFSELGDNIGDFFTNIWDNISSSITNITDSIHDWWQGVKDWWNGLFKVSDGYFDDYLSRWDDWLYLHFGFLYQSFELVYTFFDLVVVNFTDTDLCFIQIPAIVLPFGDITLTEEINFDLAGYIVSNSTFHLLYQLFRGFAQGCMLLWLFNWSIKEYQKRFGSEGG